MSLKSLIPSRHLLAQSQQKKHQNKAPSTPKADDKNTTLRQWRRSGILTVNPEHTLHTAPAFPSPTPNMQLPVGYLQLKLILKSYQNVVSNSNIQRNDIIEKSFTHYTIDVMSLVILICNEKLSLLYLVMR